MDATQNTDNININDTIPTDINKTEEKKKQYLENTISPTKTATQQYDDETALFGNLQNYLNPRNI